MPLKRLKSKTTRECLWPYILSLMREGPLYAYEIRTKIKKRFGFKIGQVTAYVVLYKLEKGGYVVTNWERRDNRKRKYYQLTPNGEKLLKQGIGYLRELSEKLAL